MPDLGDAVAANVRALRAHRKWRQEDLAERMGWSAGRLGHLETGRRAVKVSDLPILCRAFGVSLERLLDGADPGDLDALDIG